jgi:hypothetical protein
MLKNQQHLMCKVRVVVQIGIVKMYAAAVEGSGKRKDRMKLSVGTTKIGGKTSLGPSYFV